MSLIASRLLFLRIRHQSCMQVLDSEWFWSRLELPASCQESSHSSVPPLHLPNRTPRGHKSSPARPQSVRRGAPCRPSHEDLPRSRGRRETTPSRARPSNLGRRKELGDRMRSSINTSEAKESTSPSPYSSCSCACKRWDRSRAQRACRALVSCEVARVQVTEVVRKQKLKS